MDPQKLRALLERVHAGDAGVDEAMRELADLPFKDLGFARVDHHRHLRTGFPEVVLGLGKTAEQIGHIVTELARTGANVLATRVADGSVAGGAAHGAGRRATRSWRARSSSSSSRSPTSGAARC